MGEGARRFRLALPRPRPRPRPRLRPVAIRLVAGRALVGYGPAPIWCSIVKGLRKVRPAHPAERPRNRCARVLVTVCALAGIAHGPAAAQPSADATLACGAAATRAERDWHLPSGLLAAIGTIESGRRAPTGLVPTIWPWTINAEGRGFYQPSKAAAIDMVRILLLRGARLIDVGCFQVDLFYHPYAFANLEAAFDPDANAGAAARILSLGRLGSTGWDGAIAAYHSALPPIGAAYLQKVRAVWPWIMAHPSWNEPAPPGDFAVLLSPQARLVRVVTPDTAVSAQSIALPRVLSTGRPSFDPSEATIQWLHQPVEALPSVLSPIDAGHPASRPTTGRSR